jgi:oxygen-dependent protoporphyrinogen oxidase
MKVCIVGGGITGLSAAWFLKKRHPNAQITLLEKTNRLGGWIQTSYENGFLFEKGPRTFQIGRSPTLLLLLEELGLKIIQSDPSAAKRYLFYNNKLKEIRSFWPLLLPYAIREFFLPSKKVEDESIYDFACRRFSPKIAELFFDPLTLGIFAGDIKKLSMKACFPTFLQWEQEKGSLLKGLLKAPKKEKGLFTLPNGMQTLIDTLQKKLQIEIIFNCEVTKIQENQVFTKEKVWEVDRVISALPPKTSAKSIWVVHVAFKDDVLSKKGFGYLIPSLEKEQVLGAIFDSKVFPQQSKKEETRLTFMVREDEKNPLQAVRSALKRHLKIDAEPIYSSYFLAERAIPQFEVGCNLNHNLSVEGCVQRGEKFSLQI